MSFPRRINILRWDTGLTDGELADIYGCSRQTLLNWSEGTTSPTKRNAHWVEFVTIKLELARKAKLLPLSNKLRNDVRIALMKRRLKESFEQKIT